MQRVGAMRSAGVAVVANNEATAQQSEIVVHDCDADERLSGVSLLQFMSTLGPAGADNKDAAGCNVLNLESTSSGGMASVSDGVPDAPEVYAAPLNAAPSPERHVEAGAAAGGNVCGARRGGDLQGPAVSGRAQAWGDMPRGRYPSLSDVELRPGTALVESAHGGSCRSGGAAAASVTEVSLADMAPHLFAADIADQVRARVEVP